MRAAASTARAIKPAFMKIGVDAGAALRDRRQAVRAAALTHRETGLPIASHTATGAAAMEELDLLERRACRCPRSSGCTPTTSATRRSTRARPDAAPGWSSTASRRERRAPRRARAAHEAQGLLDASWSRTMPAGIASASPAAAIPALRHAVHEFLPALKSPGFTRRTSTN